MDGLAGSRVPGTEHSHSKALNMTQAGSETMVSFGVGATECLEGKGTRIRRVEHRQPQRQVRRPSDT